MAKILGRPPRCNLLRDGFEEAAEYARTVMRNRNCDHLVLVTLDGTLRTRPISGMGRRDHQALLASPDLVGTYNRHVRIEVLEDDLLAREREIRAALAKRKAA